MCLQNSNALICQNSPIIQKFIYLNVNIGGVCALIACAFVGPRLGRFTKQNKPLGMPGHSVPLAGLGGFILLFGFLAFNGGSQVSCLANNVENSILKVFKYFSAYNYQ